MQLRAFLERAGAKRPTVLVIDALNQLDPSSRSHDLDWLPLWAGQSAGLSACTDVSVFLRSLLEDVSAVAGPISDWSAKYREHHPAA